MEMLKVDGDVLTLLLLLSCTMTFCVSVLEQGGYWPNGFRKLNRTVIMTFYVYSACLLIHHTDAGFWMRSMSSSLVLGVPIAFLWSLNSLRLEDKRAPLLSEDELKPSVLLARMLGHLPRAYLQSVKVALVLSCGAYLYILGEPTWHLLFATVVIQVIVATAHLATRDATLRFVASRAY